MSFSGFSLTEDRVENLLSRAMRRDDGKYVAEIDEDDPLEGRSEFDIQGANWIAVEDQDDPFESARMLRAAEEAADDDDIFLRVGGTITSAGRDDNGVTLLASALRSFPKDFQDRTTLLYNHDVGTPIGRVINSRVVRASAGKPARGVITADVHRAAVNPKTQMTFAESIRARILNKYSFAWRVLRGELIFDLSGEGRGVVDEDEETLTIPFGAEYAPEINVSAMRATEPSVVSVPADASANLTVARQFARSLAAVRDNYIESMAGLLVPVSAMQNIPTVDRPFHPGFSLARVTAWASEGAELDLTNDFDFARFAQAFAGHVNDGRSVEDWYGLHCDVVDGALVWCKRAVAHCLSEVKAAGRSADLQRMACELSLVHEIDIDV